MIACLDEFKPVDFMSAQNNGQDQEEIHPSNQSCQSHQYL
jgi:hypothetical protein